jgi:hypothetical protein
MPQAVLVRSYRMGKIARCAIAARARRVRDFAHAHELSTASAHLMGETVSGLQKAANIKAG